MKDAPQRPARSERSARPQLPQSPADLEKMTLSELLDLRDNLQNALMTVVFAIGTHPGYQITKPITTARIGPAQAQPPKRIFSQAAKRRMSAGMRKFWRERKAQAARRQAHALKASKAARAKRLLAQRSADGK